MHPFDERPFMLALEGIRVLDLTRYLPGGFATLWLADLGADVIKIESPGVGDLGRWLGDPNGSGLGPYFAALNRGKRSLCLDLKATGDVETFLKLVQTADVLIESFRPGVMARLGLDYDKLSAINPRLIYCAISGYGQNGPASHRPGHDLDYVAESGMLSVGAMQQTPLPLPVQIADVGGGAMPALTSILAALLARTRSGRGQFLDVSMLGGTLAWLAFLLPVQAATPGVDEPSGTGMLTGRSLCYNVYECADGRHLAISALEPKFWFEVCERLARPDLKPLGFNPQPGAEERMAAFRAFIRSQPLAHWLACLGDDVCCAPVLTLDEMQALPAVQASGLISIEPASGLPQIGFPVALSDTPAAARRPAPRLGEHTQEILAELETRL